MSRHDDAIRLQHMLDYALEAVALSRGVEQGPNLIQTDSSIWR